jgi:hypothetical protein
MNASKPVIMNKLYAFLLGLGLMTAVLAQAGPGQAALGEPVDSIAGGQKALSAVQPFLTVRNGYTVQEVRSDAVVVREYISPAGIVFAVAWNGLIHPDLTPLLGSHAGAYEEALRQTPSKPGSRHLQVKADQIIVEKWGQMRNLQGRAYIPALLPPGVSADEIE